jgi:DNA-binding transcriptional ArsR family regulator
MYPLRGEVGLSALWQPTADRGLWTDVGQFRFGRPQFLIDTANLVRASTAEPGRSAGSLGRSTSKLNQWVDKLSALTLINRMVDHQLDITFMALADPTRRGMLAALSLGEKPVSELAAPYRMSLAGAAKHVGVLARAGLIERRKVGRQQLCRLRGDRLKEASDWLAQWERFWTGRLDALEAALKEDQE